MALQARQHGRSILSSCRPRTCCPTGRRSPARRGLACGDRVPLFHSNGRADMAGCLSLACVDERRVSAEVRTPRRPRASWIIAINIAVFVLMLLTVEMAARGLSYLLRGSGTA